MWPTRCRSERALLRAQSGLGASHFLSAAPTTTERTVKSETFQAVVRRRLRWPLSLLEGQVRQTSPKRLFLLRQNDDLNKN